RQRLRGFEIPVSARADCSYPPDRNGYAAKALGRRQAFLAEVVSSSLQGTLQQGLSRGVQPEATVDPSHGVKERRMYGGLILILLADALRTAVEHLAGRDAVAARL